MFKWSIEYLTSYGSSCIKVNYYNCRAFTPFGAWRKFRRDTIHEYHYAGKEYLSNFLTVFKEDIQRGWRENKGN